MNTGAQVLGTPPPITTGLLGSVCWLGPELAGGGCHHRTACQSAAARGGLYPSRGPPSRGTECGLVQPGPWPGLLLAGAGTGRPRRPAGWGRRETAGGSALVWRVAAWGPVAELAPRVSLCGWGLCRGCGVGRALVLVGVSGSGACCAALAECSQPVTNCLPSLPLLPSLRPRGLSRSRPVCWTWTLTPSHLWQAL